MDVTSVVNGQPILVLRGDFIFPQSVMFFSVIFNGLHSLMCVRKIPIPGSPSEISGGTLS